MTGSLFGILILERNPLILQDVPGLLQVWLQDAGGFAALGLAVYLIYAMTAPTDQPESAKTRMPVTRFMLLMAVICLFSYVGYSALVLTKKGIDTVNPVFIAQPGESWKQIPPKFTLAMQPMLLMIAGLSALLGIGQPFARDLLKLKFNRIWALSKVGFTEARRSPLFIILLLFVAVFLFPAQWFVPTKAEDELRLTIGVATFVTLLFTVIPAMILSSFQIPRDIKDQTIYTIVSKPVERFEVVLGRFFGYSFLMSVTLLFMTTLSFLWIATSNIDPKAVEETYTARMPQRGTLAFKSRKGDVEGTNVGREFEYRKYISGHPSTSERAIWSFDKVSSGLANSSRDAVPCEFTFDIFRLTKGDENVGVFVNLRLASYQAEQVAPSDRSGIWAWTDLTKQQAYEADVKKAEAELGGRSLSGAKPGSKEWAKVNELAKKYGFFEIGTVEVYDYHPTTVMVPSGLFENARNGDATGKPRFQVFVKCLSPGQMLGMAEGDLYLLEGTQPYIYNYFKNALSTWFLVTMVIGVAVAMSTYLSGIVSFLATLFLFISALAVEHLRDVAYGISTGGGPMESLTRLLKTESPTAILDQSAQMKTVTIIDQVYAWMFRRYANIVPDVDSFLWTHFLKEGFNINGEYLIVNAVVLVGYLLPWAILSYYLFRNREVAA